MIRVDTEGSKVGVEVAGIKSQLQAEFMSLVHTLFKDGVFTNEEELLMCCQFAMLNDKERNAMLIEMLDDTIKFYEDIIKRNGGK